jgi:hypothetical protein
MHGTVPTEEDEISYQIAGDAVDARLYDLITARYPRCQLTHNMCKTFKEQYGFVSDAKDRVEVMIPVDGTPTPHDITNELKNACEILIPPIVEGIRKLVSSFNPEFQEKPISPAAAGCWTAEQAHRNHASSAAGTWWSSTSRAMPAQRPFVGRRHARRVLAAVAVTPDAQGLKPTRRRDQLALPFFNLRGAKAAAARVSLRRRRAGPANQSGMRKIPPDARCAVGLFRGRAGVGGGSFGRARN